MITVSRLHPVVRIAPAKLNLTLAVLGRRPDGFHDLHSVMVPLRLADIVSVAPAAGQEDTLAVAGLAGGLVADPVADNLVLRAIHATREAVRAALGPGHAVPALAARLDKRIPIAAGLGGGSSDAAAAIGAALDAWRVAAAMSPADVATLTERVAARLGSDVPFFLAAGAAVVTGRGERVEPLPALRGAGPGVLLVTPSVAGPTPAVFAAFDHEPNGTPSDRGSSARSSEHLAHEWRVGLRADALMARAGVLASANDLVNAAAVVVPGLRELRRALGRHLVRPVGISGSGPTLWVLYASPVDAQFAAEAVREGLADGSIVAPGVGNPSIVSTAIAASPVPPNPALEQGGIP